MRGKRPAVLAQRFLEATGYNGLLGKGEDDVTGNESPDWMAGNPRKSINKLLVRGRRDRSVHEEKRKKKRRSVELKAARSESGER